MASAAPLTNGVYLVAADGTKIPLKRMALNAIREMIDGRKTGKVILHFRNGGLAHVSDERVYQDD